MIGDNLLNNSLVFLDPFKYNSALMFVLGKVGSGKSYLVKLLALRLLYMGVEVDIWDKTGEYEPLKQLTNLSNLHVHHYDTIEEYQKHMQKYILEMDSNVRLKKRFLIIDEFWEYLDNNYIMAKIEYISRTGRKKHQGLCVITQLIEDLNKSQRAKSILRMASIKTLMQMEPNAAKVVQNILDITDEEVNFLISAQNEGILFAGSRHVQFKAAASEEEDIIIDTNPENRVKRQEFKEVAAGVIKETTC
jgi:type IV secretory pathway VirB4 component